MSSNKTPEDFCKEKGVAGGSADMTENCLVWAMMRQYAEYCRGNRTDLGNTDGRSIVDVRQMLIDEIERAHGKIKDMDGPTKDWAYSTIGLVEAAIGNSAHGEQKNLCLHCEAPTNRVFCSNSCEVVYKSTRR